MANKRKPIERPYYIKQLKDLMKSNKVTQEKLGKIINKTRPTVASYLDGRTHIDVKTLQDLADYFGVPVTHFFEEGQAGGMQHKDDDDIAGEPKVDYRIGQSIEEIAMAAGSQITPQPASQKPAPGYEHAMNKAIDSLSMLVEEKERVIRLLEAQLKQDKKKGRN